MRILHTYSLCDLGPQGAERAAACEYTLSKCLLRGICHYPPFNGVG